MATGSLAYIADYDDDDADTEDETNLDWNIKGTHLRGRFTTSQDGRCPRCGTTNVVFVILDVLFPMGDMPEILCTLIAKGKAVLWSSQTKKGCKAPPTFLCRGFCPPDPLGAGFNVNWNNISLQDIFFSSKPNTSTANTGRESREGEENHHVKHSSDDEDDDDDLDEDELIKQMLAKEAEKIQDSTVEEKDASNENPNSLQTEQFISEDKTPVSQGTDVDPACLKTTHTVYITTTSCESSETSTVSTSASSSAVHSSVYQYPVSHDGSCPHCYSKNVKYIIVFTEGMQDEELPYTLQELLKRNQAFKMAEGTNEPPSFQCQVCHYGFNLDWSSTNLELIFGIAKGGSNIPSTMLAPPMEPPGHLAFPHPGILPPRMPPPGIPPHGIPPHGIPPPGIPPPGLPPPGLPPPGVPPPPPRMPLPGVPPLGMPPPGMMHPGARVLPPRVPPPVRPPMLFPPGPPRGPPPRAGLPSPGRGAPRGVLPLRPPHAGLPPRYPPAPPHYHYGYPPPHRPPHRPPLPPAQGRYLDYGYHPPLPPPPFDYHPYPPTGYPPPFPPLPINPPPPGTQPTPSHEGRQTPQSQDTPVSTSDITDSTVAETAVSLSSDANVSYSDEYYSSVTYHNDVDESQSQEDSQKLEELLNQIDKVRGAVTPEQDVSMVDEQNLLEEAQEDNTMDHDGIEHTEAKVEIGFDASKEQDAGLPAAEDSDGSDVDHFVTPCQSASDLRPSNAGTSDIEGPKEDLATEQASIIMTSPTTAATAERDLDEVRDARSSDIEESKEHDITTEQAGGTIKSSPTAAAERDSGEGKHDSHQVSDVENPQGQEEVVLEFDVKRTVTIKPNTARNTRRTRRSQQTNSESARKDIVLELPSSVLEVAVTATVSTPPPDGKSTDVEQALEKPAQTSPLEASSSHLVTKTTEGRDTTSCKESGEKSSELSQEEPHPNTSLTGRRRGRSQRGKNAPRKASIEQQPEPKTGSAAIATTTSTEEEPETQVSSAGRRRGRSQRGMAKDTTVVQEPEVKTDTSTTEITTDEEPEATGSPIGTRRGRSRRRPAGRGSTTSSDTSEPKSVLPSETRAVSCEEEPETIESPTERHSGPIKRGRALKGEPPTTGTPSGETEEEVEAPDSSIATTCGQTTGKASKVLGKRTTRSRNASDDDVGSKDENSAVMPIAKRSRKSDCNDSTTTETESSGTDEQEKNKKSGRTSAVSTTRTLRSRK